MKRTLVVLITVAGAAVLVFAAAANLFPDWIWEVLNTARTKTSLFGEKAPVIELSKYAPPPGGSAEVEPVPCPLPPQNSLYTIVVPTPGDESCSPQVGDLSLNNYGMVGNPLRGWVGCIDGHDLKGVRIDALSSDGKDRLASTITNSKGRFVFQNLKAGTYHLAVNSRGLGRVDAVVTTNPRSQDALCLVAAGTTGHGAPASRPFFGR
ncbi:MAG: carboxypeptidase-like regulatory domain-containing protein [Terriglobales bacterium]